MNLLLASSDEVYEDDMEHYYSKYDELVDRYYEDCTKAWCKENNIDYESYKAQQENYKEEPLEELPW